jgi:tetratricopeptide (TPR) repeat protein
MLSIGPIYLQRGEIGQALKMLEGSIPLAEQANFAIPLSARIVLAWFYSFFDPKRGFELAHQALDKAKALGRTQAFALAALARLYLESEDLAKAQTTIKEALEELAVEQSAATLFYTWFIHMVEGEIALANQAYDDAFAVIDRTVTSTKMVGIRPFLTYMLFLKAQALIGLNRITEAYQILLEARAETEAQGSAPNLQRLQILIGLSEFEAQAGNTAEARGLRKEAREVIEFIADHMDDAKIRHTFLASPYIRSVLED